MQAIRKKLPPPENTLSQLGPSQAAAPGGQQQGNYLAPEDYVAQDEIFKVCLGSPVLKPPEGVALLAAYRAAAAPAWLA